MINRPAIAAALVAAASALGACGGDDDAAQPTTSSAAAVVAKVLVDHYAMPTCEELTQKAERTFGYGPGPDCDKVIADRNPPKDVKVSDVRVDGDKATGVADGFTFALVRRSGTWFIDGGG